MAAALTFAPDQPFSTFRSVVGTAGRIEVSDDGRNFRKIAELPSGGAPDQTASFPAVSARIFRLTFNADTPRRLNRLAFSGSARVNRFEDKAGFSTASGLEEFSTPTVPSIAAIGTSAVIDLTTRLRPDGGLDWTPPQGRWTVLRLGYSLTGKTNHPASAEGTGLEVDELSRKHVSSYLDQYLSQYEKILGPDLVGRRGLGFLVTDSYEAGAANWTDDMIGEFTRRRGYDPKPWLPVLTGRVVGSSETRKAA